MIYSRSTIILAMSMVMVSLSATVGDKHPVKTSLPAYAMNEVIGGRLLVKMASGPENGPAQPRADVVSRLSAKLRGGRIVGQLSHGGWTVWEFPTNDDPRAVAASLQSDPDVLAVEPENRLYTVSLPVPNDPDWKAIENNPLYIYHGGSNGGGGYGGSSGGYSGGSGAGSGGSGGGSGGSGGTGGNGGSGGGGGTGGSGSGSGSSGNGNSNFKMVGKNPSVTGFRRLWNLWDSHAVVSDAGGVVTGGWAVYPGTWYTASSKPTDCPIIAFVDTGADMGHPDFINAGGTGTDTSQGGQLMKSQSVSFQAGKPIAKSTPTDNDGHGTAVAGVAIAAGNNGGFGGAGMIGVGYNSRGMILNVLDSKGMITDDNVAAAIYYAADNHADIINISLGTTNYSQILQDAVTYAFQTGSLVVAAGNESDKGGGNLGPFYPASCSGALGVAANGPGRVSAVRDYGGSGNYVGIAAPGGDLVPFASSQSYIQFVYSTAARYPCTLSEKTLNPPYHLNYTYDLNGTSMAAPHVSGAAGLYYGQNGLHQADGNANLRAFQALQISAGDTNNAPNGGWEPTQGYGSLDVQSLLKLPQNPRPRYSTAGDVTGIAYYNGKILPGATVTATQTGPPFASYTTTTQADGTYRFKAFPGGIYNVTLSHYALTPKTKRVQVTNGCDMPGVDFFCGTAKLDSTPPIVGRFRYLQQTQSTIDFDQWAYDPQTEIDSATVQLGRTPGASDLFGPQVIIPGNTRVHLSRLVLPTHYYATFTYKNGVGETSLGMHAAQGDTQDAYVSDAHPTLGSVNSNLNVSAGAKGANQVSYLTIDISAMCKNIWESRLTLTGAAVGSPVNVGVYGTNNAAWTESTLNWSDAPSLVGGAVDKQSVGAEGNYTWNITSLVAAAKAAGSKTVTIAIACESNSAGAVFNSLRSSGRAPLVQATTSD